jgi:cytochrome b involved in lipid metabolism
MENNRHSFRGVLIALVILVVGIGAMVLFAKKTGAPETNPYTQDTGTSASLEGTNPNGGVNPAADDSNSMLDADSSTYTMAEVSSHNGASSCWTIINSVVYDVTSWINAHPGGSQPILGLCGKDGTSAFTAKHGGQPQPEAELASFKIGTLAR